MAKKPTKLQSSLTNAATWMGFAEVDSNGVAPDSRVPNSNDAFFVATQLQLDNLARDHRNSRIYKCYKMFAPTDYSLIVKKEMMGLSNTPFGQMRYRVDNRKGTFFDMVAQRTLAAMIATKKGRDSERKFWGDSISVGWNMVLNNWNSYYYNVNQDIEEMSLYGKGFEVAEDMSGWPTRSYHNSSILVPDYTYADLTNLGEFCIKRSYTPLELWEKIGRGDKEFARKAGWNFDACVEALRLHTSNYQNRWTQAEWLRQVASGSLNLSRYYQQKVNVFELIVKEYDGSVSKMMVLQNYDGFLGAYNNPSTGKGNMTEEEYRQKTGFLYYKKDWVSKKDFNKYGWLNVMAPIIDIPGSGLWHEIKGFAEGIFSQCRAYDIHMNQVMNALMMNMKFMLKGGSAEAAKKIKQMDWGAPMMALPHDVEPIQHRFEMPMAPAIDVMRFYMGEVDRGTGQQTNFGKNQAQVTATEAQLDAAENAKIRGTELSQFNICQTGWNQMLFRRFLRTKSGGTGYHLKERFLEFMDECGVPEEAYAEENIQDIQSMMLSGAGSVSFKIMASEKLIALTGMTPANPGQEAAIRDGIAALGGVQNMQIYRPRQNKDRGDDAYRVIAQENIGFTTPNVNIESLQVEPMDPHLEHFLGHFSDMMLKLDKAEARIQQHQAKPEYLIPLLESFALEGGHMSAHLEYIKKDVSKQNEAKQLSQSLNQVKRRVDEITAVAQEMSKQQQPEQMTKEQQDLQYIVAKNALDLKNKEDLANQKRGERALDHAQRDQNKKEQAATALAIKRAEAIIDEQIKTKEAEADQLESALNGSE